MSEAIAIVGIGCRLPGGVDSPETFWRLLKDGRDAIVEVPPERWNADAFYDPTPGRAGKTISRWGGFLESIDQFDAEFFGISPREAASMDPQHRLLLQTAWEAIEDGGVTLVGDEVRAGVFVGISTNDYAQLQFSPGDHRALNPWSATGGVASIAANQISYCLNLRGPSFAVDTACSSSLVALHLACASIRRGECPMALVGGVNALLIPAPFVSFSRSGMLSPDGRCKAFDARANGFVRAEGAGMIVLMPLTAAVSAGHPIYAVIRGTAINQDGRTNGLSMPNAAAQAELVRAACADAGIHPGEVQYVEAHGTGTAVGDPIEAEALATTIGAARPAGDPCVIGSVKTNIGHLEAGAGITGVIKTALSLFHGQIPPSLHFETPNPRIDFTRSNLRIARTLETFPPGGSPLAGVNSFGFGGTNAHAILEAPPARSAPAAPAETPAFLLPISARSEPALRDLTAKYIAFLKANHVHLTDVCFTAGVARTHHAFRLAVAAATREELQEKLTASLARESCAGRASEEPAAPVFVFSGQGSQWCAMGRELLAQEPLFREKIEECDEILRGLGNWSLVGELRRDEATSRLHDTAIAQPAIFAVQMALVALWRSWGISPAAVVGHSVGEVAAACTAGVLMLRDAMHTIFHRGRCMSFARDEGRMLAVGAPAGEAERMIEGLEAEVSIGAINGPRSVVLTGARGALERIAAVGEARGIFCRFLKVDYAFHSPQMDPARDELLRSLGHFPTHAPEVPIYSTVSGAEMASGDFAPEYWWSNVRQSVRFSAAIEALLAHGHRVFLEVSPHPVLAAPMLECLQQHDCSGTVLPSLRRNEPERATLLGSLGALHVSGNRVNWRAVYPEGTIIRLPTYAWQNERYWNECEDWRWARIACSAHPLLDRPMVVATPTWQTTIDLEAFAYLKDHRVHGQIVFPAAAYLDMSLGGAGALLGSQLLVLENIEFRSALFLSESEKPVCLQWSQNPGSTCFAIGSTRDGTTWTTHAVGRFAPGTPASSAASIETRRRTLIEVISGEASRRQFAETGLHFGASFAGSDKIYRRDGEALARVVLPDGLEASEHPFHPCLLDACFQALAHALSSATLRQRRLFLPVQVDRVRFFARPGASVWSHARLTHQGGRTIEGNIEVLDPEGRLLLAVEGFRCQAVVGNESDDDWCYQLQWQPATATEAGTRQQAACLLLTDRAGLGTAVANRLRERGNHVLSVSAGTDFVCRDKSSWEVRPGSRDDFQRLFAELRTSGLPEITDIIHLWNLDAVEPTALNEEEGCHSLFTLLQVMTGERALPRLWLVTRGAQSVASTDLISPAQAPALGVGRVVLNEFPQLRCRMIDLPAQGTAEDASLLLNELALDDREDEVAYRDGVRHVHRLSKVSAAELPGRSMSASYRLKTGRTPGLDQLAFRPHPRIAPGAGELEIEIRSAGLNFRDVLKALGIYPSEDESDSLLGDECAGRVVTVGEGVDEFASGDDVVAIAPGCFGSHLTLPANRVIRRPAGLSEDEAATIPVAFLTAWFALHHLGRLQQGERVLIHAATGGVGLAAIQVAKHFGAEIFATAGSPEKREHLRSIGIRHVMDSRSLAFADEVRALTNGRGVDVVLNSLSGEAIAKGVACLALGGRFLEIGKRDIYANAALELRPFRNNLSFFAIDLAQVLREQPDLMRSMLRDVMALVTSQRLRPLPLRRFELADAREAFREMSQARHIGKLVLSRESSPPLSMPGPDSLPMRFRPDATYLITGGLSGFGFAVAEWMQQNGAQHLVLVSRSGATGEALARLQKSGTEVIAMAADIACPEDADRVFSTIAQQMPPLRGVVHSAMVIEDCTLLQQSGETFQRVMAPKVAGSWNLHTRTAKLDLDYFVLFSSVSAIVGNPGQASYAAANCFLDALAHHRRALGLPALAIDWGMLTDVGYVSRTAGLSAALEHHGVNGLTANEATQILGRLLQSNVAQVGVFRIDWRRAVDAMPGLATSARFASLLESLPSVCDGGSASAIAAILALPAEERLSALTTQIAEHAAHVLQTSASRLDVQRPLGELGFDSLMSIELANRLEAVFKVTLPLGSIQPGLSVAKLAERLLGTVAGAEAPLATQPVEFPQLVQEGTAALAINPAPIESPAVLPQPERTSPALQLRFRFEWLVLRAMHAVFRRIDIQRARAYVRLLTPLATTVFRHDWKWAVGNLKLVFGPNLSDAERTQLVRLAFEHHMSSYLEGLRHADVAVEFEHHERLVQSHAQGRGVILCGVHLGSWESVLPHAARVGLPVVGVYRRAFNPLSDRVFQETRSDYRIEWIASDDADAIVSALRDGKIVGLMTDLNTISGGTVADFLGIPATCPSGPARLAVLHGAPIVPAVAIRAGPGRVTVRFEPPIIPEKSDSPAQITRAINAIFEPSVLEYAEQYNWMHPRWRNRPDGRRWNLRLSDAEFAQERTAPFLAVPERVRQLLNPIS